MMLSGFARPDNPVGADLPFVLAAATGLVIVDAAVTPDEAWVKGDITEDDRDAIQAAMDAYHYDPDYFTPPEQRALRIHRVLRDWAADADSVSNNWASMTTVQKDNAIKTTIQRLGLLCARTADLLRYLSVDTGDVSVRLDPVVASASVSPAAPPMVKAGTIPVQCIVPTPIIMTP